MPEPHLAVYLQDHRAGATAAIELLKHLEAWRPDSAVARFAADLRVEVTADIRELEDVMSQVGTAPSPSRNGVAWLTEKVAELKVRFDDPGDGSLHLLQALESLALGIDGKRALWLALSSVDGLTPSRDYARLIHRAETQRRLVEDQRLLAANAAFGSR